MSPVRGQQREVEITEQMSASATSGETEFGFESRSVTYHEDKSQRSSEEQNRTSTLYNVRYVPNTVKGHEVPEE